MCSRVYEGLLEYAYLDRPYHAEPRLAESDAGSVRRWVHVHVSHQEGRLLQRRSVFPRRQRRELTADDFVYAFTRVLDPKIESTGDWIFVNHVAGAKSGWKRAMRRRRYRALSRWTGTRCRSNSGSRIRN